MKKLLTAFVILCFMSSVALAHPLIAPKFITYAGEAWVKMPKGHLLHQHGSYSKTVFGTGALLGPQIMLGLIGTVIVLNAAAWDKAKDNHSEIAYQMKQRFPQQFFGTVNAAPHVGGNSGNFAGGNSGPIQE